MQKGLNVQLAAPIDEKQRAEWYKKNGLSPDGDGVFTELPYGEGPVVRDTILDQVALNAKRQDVPNLTTREYTPRIMVYVGGGPTIRHFLDEIREKCESDKYDVFTSNKTCSYLLSKGIKPNFHIIVDPTQKKVKDLEYDEHVELVLGLQCHPDLFEFAKNNNRKVWKFLAASITNDDGRNDREMAKEATWSGDPEMLGIGGGSMCGTRMLYFAAARGYRKLEYYGVDGSIEMKDNKLVNCYAYFKPRGENIIEMEASNGRVFYSTITLGRQAEELTQMMDILPGMEVEVFGDSLMANHLAIYKKLRKGLSVRWTPQYMEMQKQLHSDNELYGISGGNQAARVFMAAAQLSKKIGGCSVLDYGCGPGSLFKAMTKAFPDIPGVTLHEYDPGMEGKNEEPKPADLVYCGDVLEHIEPECTDAVIQHLSDLTKHMLIAVIDLEPAKKILADGRNAHVCLQKPNWWLSKLRRHFYIAEEQQSPRKITVICLRFPK